MGRTPKHIKATPVVVDVPHFTRSKRNKKDSTGGSSKSTSSICNEISGEDPTPTRGNRASFHCNYCNKDITGKVRIKCAVCVDFDLCVECFSVGAQVHLHKNNHPYRIMETLSFPLFSPDWTAEDESLLLEGLDMYGPSNWAEVAEHVGTKTKDECSSHYTEIYLNSKCSPLPDMSRLLVKTKEEALAMAQVRGGAGKDQGTSSGAGKAAAASVENAGSGKALEQGQGQGARGN